jgi:hypothetical protein
MADTPSYRHFLAFNVLVTRPVNSYLTIIVYAALVNTEGRKEYLLRRTDETETFGTTMHERFRCRFKGYGILVSIVSAICFRKIKCSPIGRDISRFSQSGFEAIRDAFIVIKQSRSGDWSIGSSCSFVLCESRCYS